ncbi:radical SAM protein [Streptomyces litchfieldiae]|uniref:Radical SAM protein n=1 Tax=Streptomyces litchfieldiae TaxID=3075543 RepID=A0ABU2MYM1_9ACTN|nr:radical SAM protein [Streptomyces sp. DSM 44938]MDT0346745.1 radical SAM protein [Streptomyces sp. DSM 44938]
MTTSTPVTPAPADGIRSVELELTGACNLACTHCCTDSSPQANAGAMTLIDWQRVINDIAHARIPAVQFIGGEPTLSPHLPALIDHALSRGLGVEVYSNLVHIRPSLWGRFERDGVRLATSYYSDDPTQHEQITGGRGSHGRTLANIREALARGIPLRVGIVRVIEGQRVEQAEAELRRLGVDNIRIDRTRKVGRAAENGAPAGMEELCGRCYHQRAAVGPDGEVYGCILSRDFPTGNVREERLPDIFAGTRWVETAAKVPMAADACPPDDSGDCDPANTEACDPAYDVAPPPSLGVVA